MADMEKTGVTYREESGSPDGRDYKVDLSNNISARIKNPLAGKSREELYYDIDTFASQYGLQDITDVLRKGALVAQNPPEFENVPGLTEDERAVLRDEIVHKWR